MEFHEKLQELRKTKGLTQEELAEVLYVSRTAISKWESGRGMPNIESLKAIAKFFGITVDVLLSSEEVLGIAEDECKRREAHIRNLIFGLLDGGMALLLFLPFFGQEANGVIQGVSLLAMTEVQTYLKILYLIVVIGMTVLGVLSLFLHNHSYKLSLVFNAAGVVLFIISQQPYAAVFVFVFLLIKASMLMK